MAYHRPLRMHGSFVAFFFALHGMPARAGDEKGVRLSAPPSDKRVHCDKTEERSIQILSYNRPFSLLFREEEWLVRATPSTWNFGSTGPR